MFPTQKRNKAAASEILVTISSLLIELRPVLSLSLDSLKRLSETRECDLAVGY